MLIEDANSYDEQQHNKLYDAAIALGISKPNQACPSAESAQSATETIAFQYKKQAPRIYDGHNPQAWFDADKHLDVKVCLSSSLKLKSASYGEDGSFSTSKVITPAQARQIAAALLNAADFAEANPDFGKVAA
jgi:hypothetical protein